MTFESLAVAGLSLGLTYTDILNIEIGLLLGIINEKNNQIMEIKTGISPNNDNNSEDVIIGDAKMLMNM